MRIATIILLFVVCGCAQRTTSPADPAALTPEQRRKRIAAAVDRGVAFLVKSQNPDGSWGTGLVTRGFEIYSMMPGSIQSFRVATTALCVMALREAGEKAAHDRGIEYLLAHGHAYRDDADLIYNIWAHIYAVQALSIELRDKPDQRFRDAIAWHIERLVRYETYSGGWNYYDFDVGARTPAMGGTSFGTAAGLVALWEARKSGCEVPQRIIDRALKTLGETRLPNGAYLYGADYRYIPRLPANMVRGSIGRTQPCNYALNLWKFAGVGQKQVVEGLDVFEKEHIFIDMGRQRQFPHESWYQTAPYYYYFDHYYAARIIENLPTKQRQHFAAALAGWLLPIQEEDGSWWDYAMWDFHKPYGTAFAVMSLLRCR